MENSPISGKHDGKVLPTSKTIDLSVSRKEDRARTTSATNTDENENEVRSQTLDNRYFMRSNTQNLYHCVSNTTVIQETRMNVLGNYQDFIRLSKIVRCLIILKILASLIYFIKSPVALIILIPEIFGYFGIRKLKTRIVLFYIMWLFVELILRAIIGVLLALDWSSLDMVLIVLFAITWALVVLGVVKISLSLRLYNMIAVVDDFNKATILRNLSLSYCPP